MARPSKDLNAVRKAREEAEKHLKEVVKGLKQDRDLVVKYLDSASFVAAKTAVETVNLTAIDKLDLDVKKLRHDAALKILKINGFEIERSEITGKDGVPLGVVVLPALREDA